MVSLHSVRSISTTVDWSFYILIYFCSLQSNIYDTDFYFKKSHVCLVQFNVTQAPSMAKLLEAVSSSEGPLYVLTVRIQNESVCYTVTVSLSFAVL